MAGLTKVSAGREEEKGPVVRQVGVVAHVAVLAHLARLHGVLGQRAIEDVEAAVRDGAVVAAVAGGRDTRKTLVPGVWVLAPQERRAGVAGQVASLAGRDPRGAGRDPQVVLAADHLPLLAAGEAEGREGGYRRRRDQRHRRRRGPHLPPPPLPVRPSGRTGIAAWAAAPQRS